MLFCRAFLSERERERERERARASERARERERASEGGRERARERASERACVRVFVCVSVCVHAGVLACMCPGPLHSPRRDASRCSQSFCTHHRVERKRWGRSPLTLTRAICLQVGGLGLGDVEHRFWPTPLPEFSLRFPGAVWSLC